jgi:Flp pilus assembly protein TadD
MNLFSTELAIHPENAECHRQFGLVLIDAQKLTEGIRNLEEAERLGPDSPSIHLNLEMAYRKAGRTEGADREHALFITTKNAHRKEEPQN